MRNSHILPTDPPDEPHHLKKPKLKSFHSTCRHCHKPILMVLRYNHWTPMTPGGSAHHSNFCPKLAKPKT